MDEQTQDAASYLGPDRLAAADGQPGDRVEAGERSRVEGSDPPDADDADMDALAPHRFWFTKSPKTPRRNWVLIGSPFPTDCGRAHAAATSAPRSSEDA